jgi:two-component system phosphate regulon sensor histidine kinase PhoR
VTGNDIHLDAQQAYAQARAYGRDLARLYAIEKERRKELETASQKLRTIFDTVPTGLAVVDNSLAILEANPRFFALFEQTAECIGHPLSNVLPIEPLRRTIASIEHGRINTGSVEIDLKKPFHRVLHIKLSPFNNNQGWVLVFHDLTEQKRLEGLKNEFINIAAHELRTPLAGVMGFVSVLREDFRDSDEPVTEIMDLILQSTERLKGIIDELVEFATTQHLKDDSLHITDIDLSRLFHKSIKILLPQIKAKGLTYQLELPQEPFMIRGDHRILTEVFYHLLENAVKFNKPQGKLAVRVEYLHPATPSREAVEQASIMIEIEDTGIGIPKTELDKIFDKFYQVEEHLVRNIGGLGLGLTIVQRGVQQHGGYISVTSQLGQGSIFRVTLPTNSELSNSSIDNRLDIAYQQMLTYAKDMAQAVATQRRLSKKIEQIKGLGKNLTTELEQLATIQGDAQAFTQRLSQTQKIAQELIKLSDK